MKHLYFMRHGLSEANKANLWSGSYDTPLSTEGHIQAEATANKVQQQGLSFDVIISSPLQRAHHTAKYIAKATGYAEDKIQLYDKLVERNFGSLEGKHHPEATQIYLADEGGIDIYEGVEKMPDLQLRAQAVLDYLNVLPYDTILLVGHGSFARALRRAVNNEPIHVRGEQVENAAIVKLI